MPKISALPQVSSPLTSDKVPVVSGGNTSYELLSDLITLFFNNIPAGAHSDVTRAAETIFDHCATGAVWTADSAGVNRNASMTQAVCYINGRRIAISAVVSRTFTASKDTYVDVLDNLDGTGTLVYTEATNNAASPALAANSVRIAIIVTGATTIAAASSINQGQSDRVLPIASSVPYCFTDSLGNLICSRDPNRKIIGYRQSVANFVTSSGANTQITGLSVPCIVPSTRKVEVELFCGGIANTNATFNVGTMWDGTIGTTQITRSDVATAVANNTNPMNMKAPTTPATASKTYNAALSVGAGTATFNASSTQPAFVIVRLW